MLSKFLTNVLKVNKAENEVNLNTNNNDNIDIKDKSITLSFISEKINKSPNLMDQKIKNFL